MSGDSTWGGSAPCGTISGCVHGPVDLGDSGGSVIRGLCMLQQQCRRGRIRTEVGRGKVGMLRQRSVWSASSSRDQLNGAAWVRIQSSVGGVFELGWARIFANADLYGVSGSEERFTRGRLVGVRTTLAKIS